MKRLGALAIWLLLAGPAEALETRAGDGTPIPYFPKLTWGMPREQALRTNLAERYAWKNSKGETVESIGRANYVFHGDRYRLYLNFDHDLAVRYGSGLQSVSIEADTCDMAKLDKLSRLFGTSFKTRFQRTSRNGRRHWRDFIGDKFHTEILVVSDCELPTFTVVIVRDDADPAPGQPGMTSGTEQPAARPR